MKSQSHLGFWLVVFCVSFLAGPALISPNDAYTRLTTEVDAMQEVFGVRIGGMLVTTANTIHGVFQRSGVEQRLASGVHSKEDLRQARTLLSGIGEGLASIASKYLVGLLLQFYGIVIRALIVLAWITLLLPILVACIADGLYARKIRRANAVSESPTAFSLGGHAVIFMAALPMLYVALPVFVTPMFMPMWLGLTMVPLRLAISNTQPIFAS